jgi:prophage regulatory protein
MNTGNRVALAARQRALAAGIERIEADAKREGRDLTMEEIAQSDALAAALATLTRQINSSNDVTASAARVDVHRGHALARGPPSGHESIWRWRTVCTHCGLSRPTVWRLVKQGKFPKPIRLTSAHAVGWLSSEVQAWIQARIAQRDQQVPRWSPVSRGRPRKVAAGT